VEWALKVATMLSFDHTVNLTKVPSECLDACKHDKLDFFAFQLPGLLELLLTPIDRFVNGREFDELIGMSGPAPEHDDLFNPHSLPIAEGVCVIYYLTFQLHSFQQ
jgi:hypothetical protein